MLKNKLKEVRKELGLTQEQLAKRLGVSRSYIGDIETGRLEGTNVKLLSKLADISGYSIEYFLGKEDQVKQYDILDSAIDMLIDKGLIDKEGNVIDDTAKNILFEILKKEIKLKLENKMN